LTLISEQTTGVAGHPIRQVGRVGVLLINLGTPDGTGYWDVRRYLSEFLSDRRVIDYPAWAWQPLLQAVILTTRPWKTGAAYQRIWNHELNESPLRTFTRSQAEQLQQRLDPSTEMVLVDWAMRYGTPSIPERMTALKEVGCDRVLVLPLYPQYSAATTGTVNDRVFESVQAMRWQPALRTVPPFHDDPAYIDALAASMRDHLDQLDWTPEVIVASYHGLPMRYFKAGDPYHCQCAKTTRLLRERLGLGADQLIMTFQSRFGPEKWLEPFTDATLAKLAKDGLRRVAVVTPAFFSDCLETLEEIAIGEEENFLEAGGTNFTAIPCLNDSPRALHLLEALVRRELSGWLHLERGGAVGASEAPPKWAIGVAAGRSVPARIIAHQGGPTYLPSSSDQRHEAATASVHPVRIRKAIG